MKKFPLTLTCLVAGVIALLAVSAYSTAPASDDGARSRGHQPDKQAAMPGMRTGHMQEDMNDMMANMPDDTMTRCRMVMNMTVSPNDPAAILALKEELKLTEAQTMQLEAINKQARDSAAFVLNVDQKEILGAIPQTPQTMKSIHEEMTQLMRDRMVAKMVDEQMSCPMVKMMKTQTSATMQPKANEPVADAAHDNAVVQ